MALILLSAIQTQIKKGVFVMHNSSTTDTLEDKVSSTAANETLEDYTLRYAPHSFRRWSPRVVAITALGGIAYLADFSIGASIGMAYGTTNAVLGSPILPLEPTTVTVFSSPSAVIFTVKASSCVLAL